MDGIIRTMEPSPEEKDELPTYSRLLHVRKYDSLHNLAKTGSTVTWTVPSKDVFLHDMEKSELDVINEQELWKNAILEEVSIAKINSGFPCNIAVDIPDARRERYCLADGGKCSYIAFPNESNYKLDAVVMEPAKVMDSSYIRDHANYMPARFTKGVLEPPNVPYKYVPVDHPIIQMINDFSKELQLSLTKKDMVDNQFYKVDKNVLEEAKQLMLPRIESMFPQSNLGEFSVNISRADGLEFNDPHGILCNVASEEAKHKIMHQKRPFDMILNVRYSFVPESR